MRLLVALSLVSLIAVIAAGSLTKVSAEDWSQFRGPNGSGVSATSGLPAEFGPAKNVVWKTALPPGHSSPVLTRDRIFVTAYAKVEANAKESARAPTESAHARTQQSPIEKENYKLLVIALDRQTGKILWQRGCREKSMAGCRT